jgi:hypothetical protein
MGGLSGNIGNGGLRDRIAGNVEADHSSSLAETDNKVEYNSRLRYTRVLETRSS